MSTQEKALEAIKRSAQLIRTPNLVEFEAALISEEENHLAVNGEERRARRIEVFGPKVMIFRHSKTSGSPDYKYL